MLLLDDDFLLIFDGFIEQLVFFKYLFCPMESGFQKKYSIGTVGKAGIVQIISYFTAQVIAEIPDIIINTAI